jgi:hypothetical protein
MTQTYTASGNGTLNLAFSEAKDWIGRFSDDSNGAFNTDGQGHADGSLLVNIDANISNASFTVPDSEMRGGFRYLSLFTGNNGVEIQIRNITCELSYQPAWSNLRAYGGFFNSSDDLLNRIWYAGAYTLQTNAIPPSSGRVFPIIGSGWQNDADLNFGNANGSTIYVDGSKRDRTVWAGDLTIAVPSILVSTGDLDGVRNTLHVLYNAQVNCDLFFALSHSR